MKMCLLQIKTVLIRLANPITVEALLSGRTANGLLREGVLQSESHSYYKGLKKCSHGAGIRMM